MMKKLFALLGKRPFIQAVASLLTNANIFGFLNGTIYTGSSKVVCVPGLNCYSCPGAVGACPIGSIQAVLGGRKHNFTFYVFGILILFGVLFGRLICGFLCMFGFIQDLLYKIPLPKIKVTPKIDKPLRYLKYIILLLFVFALPVFLTNDFGIAPPYFCQWICPAGTLEGGIPLVLSNEDLRQMLGFLFNWKLGLLIIIVLSSVFIYRPFCKYLCPLGAIYSVFNRFSLYQMQVDKDKCNGCGACEKKCKMVVPIQKQINSAECIRCGECKKVCRQGAISGCFHVKSGASTNKPVPTNNQ